MTFCWFVIRLLLTALCAALALYIAGVVSYMWLMMNAGGGFLMALQFGLTWPVTAIMVLKK